MKFLDSERLKAVNNALDQLRIGGYWGGGNRFKAPECCFVIGLSVVTSTYVPFSPSTGGE